jgi:hypothetical protein
MIALYADNANTALAAGISSSATTIIVTTGTGGLFPNPTTGQFFTLTLNDQLTGNVYEICYCTARTGDSLTVLRGQEGTTAVAWLLGDFAYNAWTAGTIETGRLLETRRFTTPGTFTYASPPGATRWEVEGAGAGGPGGGAPATGANQASNGAPGSGGSYGQKEYTSDPTGVTIVVGAPGVAALGGVGTNGAASSFGTVTFPGGIAGAVATQTPLILAGTAPAAGINGDVNNAGECGGTSINLGFLAGNGLGAAGGNSPYGTGGATVGNSVTGNPGTGFSSGGSGTYNDQGSGALTGGAPTGGVIIVRAYS